MIIGVDRGRSHVKAYCSESPTKQLLYPSFGCRGKYRELSSNEEYEITINNQKWFIGDLAMMEGGTQAFSKDKAGDEINIPLTIAAVAMLIKPTDQIIGLVTGLPISDYREQSAEYAEKLRGTWSVEFNGKNRNFNIMDVIIFPEACGAAYSTILDDSGTARSKPDQLRIIDIGEKTTDFATFNKMRYISDQSTSIPIGVAWARGETYRRQSGKTDKLPHEITPDEESLHNLSRRIASEINKFWRNWDESYLAGGGAELLEDYFLCPKLPNPQFANAVGYYRVGKTKWKV